MAARAGVPAMLRRVYPQFADCIHSPPLGPWQKYPQQEVSLAKLAAEYAKRIRALWMERFGKKNRKRGEKSAEGFAVDILREQFGSETDHLTVDAVKVAAKGTARPESPAPSSRFCCAMARCNKPSSEPVPLELLVALF